MNRFNHCYKVKLSYKGTNFYGWQIQSDKKIKTIQGELEKSLKILSKSSDVKSLGAGRTDAGVHAFNQVARINIPIEIPEEGIINGINRVIDPQIRILDCKKVIGKYNPISESEWKEYIYVFTDQRKLSPFALEYMSNSGFELDYSLMKDASKIFIGKKDFINFRCTGSETPSTIREILEIELTHHAEEGFWKLMSPDYYMLRIRGSGFMKQMVRLIVGAIWMAGRSKLSLQDLENSFMGHRSSKCGPVAPAAGLYLNKIYYRDGF